MFPDRNRYYLPTFTPPPPHPPAPPLPLSEKRIVVFPNHAGPTELECIQFCIGKQQYTKLRFHERMHVLTAARCARSRMRRAPTMRYSSRQVPLSVPLYDGGKGRGLT